MLVFIVLIPEQQILSVSLKDYVKDFSGMKGNPDNS